MCAQCDPFDTEITIHGPAQLRRIAVQSGVLTCLETEDCQAIEQKPFLDLRLDEGLPDALVYDFWCSQCRTRFGLRVECYHGQGGTWSKLWIPSQLYLTGALMGRG